MKDLELNSYVIQDISSCLSNLKPYGIMYESPSVYFPNISRVDKVDFQVWKDCLAFDITIAKTSFLINVPIKSTVSLNDNNIDFQFPNGDFLVIGLDKEIKTLDWLNIFHRKDIFKESLKESHKYNDSISLYDNLYNCSPKEMPSDDFLADLLDFAEKYDRDYNKKIDELIDMNCGEWFDYVIEYSPKAK